MWHKDIQKLSLFFRLFADCIIIIWLSLNFISALLLLGQGEALQKTSYLGHGVLSVTALATAPISCLPKGGEKAIMWPLLSPLPLPVG